jgi:hypothetical protein
VERGVSEEDRTLDERPNREPLVVDEEERPFVGVVLWVIAFAVAALFLTSLIIM